MRAYHLILTVGVVLVVALSCARDDGRDFSEPWVVDVDTPLPPPMVPGEPGSLSPTHASLIEPFDVGIQTDVESCAECHSTHVAEWRDSTHHFASFNNPFYRASFEDYVAEVGRERGRFCAGCHDPALLAGDILMKPIDAHEPRAHAGITCMSCHGIQEARPTGVGSYALKAESIERPRSDDPDSLRRHREAMRGPARQGDALCVSCHKGFLSAASGHSTFLPALDEHRPMRESSWGGSHAKRMALAPKTQSCRGCHMEQDAQGHHSHRFAGGHSTLARSMKSQEQEAAIEALVQNRIRLFIEPDSYRGDTLKARHVDVVIVNEGVGHRFPGGARDLRDTWVELELLDSEGRLLASSGRRYRHDANEQDVHRLRVGLVDKEGELVETHGVGHFRTPAFDHTIAPQDAAIARYQLPFSHDDRASQVRARLLQRRLTPAFHAYACAAASEDEGRRFADATERFTGFSVDACANQPILTLAESTFELGPGESAPKWESRYWHGVGLTHDLQEKARHAIGAFREALRLIPDGAERPEVMVRTELARALLRAGRSAEALEELEAAESILPDEPVIYALKAQALRQAWKLSEMVAPLTRALELAPNDAGLARDLALAYGSSHNRHAALKAAQHGLRLEPRDVDLLRLQMLAYQHLEEGSEYHRTAERVFLAHKRDEEAAGIRIACSRSSEECLKEQLPIPTRVLKPMNSAILE